MRVVGAVGFSPPNLTADPGSPADGDIWYRSDLDSLWLRRDGATQTLVPKIVAVTTSTTALGTSVTAISGLSVSVPVAGKYRMEMQYQIVNVGSPTNVTHTLGDGTAPSTSSVGYQIWRISSNSSDSSWLTAFNTTDSNALASPLGVTMTGYFVATGTGTIIAQGTRTGGTSSTVQVGGFLIIEKIG